ncbi:MAG: RNase adapter RapZ [Clostridiales bacterium]|jgi:UPF0042 nucleotide-binding protein|nr:RNase adapter RapZ [Clostridiales bacterium]
MRFVVVTGMSGAGKSTALRFLEDAGFYCVDNMPPELMGKFAEIAFRPGSGINKVALGIDIRGGQLFGDLLPALEELSAGDYGYSILFLDAADGALQNRFKETRRSHPLARLGLAEDGIRLEREMLSELKERADYVVDTSDLLTRELREKIFALVVDKREYPNLIVTVLSFGFKYGVPTDSDMVFDARFLPNPFYIKDLKALTGNDRAVSDYVMRFEASRIFLAKMTDIVMFLLPHFTSEGKTQLVVSVGCTGGKHRSVTLANGLYNELSAAGKTVNIRHRDIMAGR